MPTILMLNDRSLAEERIMATLIEEAMETLDRFIENGSRD